MLYVILGGEVLGLILFFFASHNHSSIGLKSIAYLLYGKKVWAYSNRLAGMFLASISTIYLSCFLFFHDNFDSFFKSYLLIALFLILLSDLLTINHYRKRQKT